MAAVEQVSSLSGSVAAATRARHSGQRPGLLASLALLGLVSAARFIAVPREDVATSTDARAPARIRTSRVNRGAGEKHTTANDVVRAAEPDRGRHARSPADIPRRGWKDILWRTYDQISDDRLLAVAAGVVFYGLLALFPAITAVVSLYALLADGRTVSQHLAELSGLLPEGAYSIVQDQVNRVLAKGNARLSLALLFSLALAVWSANGGMRAIIDALNVVYDEREKRGFITLNLVSLAFTLAGITAILIAIGLVVVAPIIFSALGLTSLGGQLVQYGRWPLLALFLLLALAVLYRFAPSRREPQWRWISVGSVFATVTWIAGSALLSYYLANFANYDATYGSLGAAIGLMIWMWMSTVVVLVGAELNAEIEHQTVSDSTEGGNKPLGRRGAAMADTVGEAK